MRIFLCLALLRRVIDREWLAVNLSGENVTKSLAADRLKPRTKPRKIATIALTIDLPNGLCRLYIASFLSSVLDLLNAIIAFKLNEILVNERLLLAEPFILMEQ